jgi:hypothetical protein
VQVGKKEMSGKDILSLKGWKLPSLSSSLLKKTSVKEEGRRLDMSLTEDSVEDEKLKDSNWNMNDEKRFGAGNEENGGEKNDCIPNGVQDENTMGSRLLRF